MMTEGHKSSGELDVEYEAPRLISVGSLAEATLGCDKTLGQTDGFTFQGQSIVCNSA